MNRTRRPTVHRIFMLAVLGLLPALLPHWSAVRGAPTDNVTSATGKGNASAAKSEPAQDSGKAPAEKGEPAADPNPALLDPLDNPWTYKGFLRGLALGTRTAGITGSKSDFLWATTKGRIGAEYAGKRWVAELRGDLEWIFSGEHDDTTFRALTSTQANNEALPLRRSGRVGGDALLGSNAHRLNAGYKTNDRHFVVGRQAIGWGEGRLINPLDLITPSGPFLVDSEDVPGADALNFTEFVGADKSLQVVAVAHRSGNESDAEKISSTNADLLTRWKSSGADVEWSVVGGRHFRSMVLGAELVLLKWDASIRMAALARREESEQLRLGARDKSIFVLGWSYAFDGGKLPVSLEALYNDGAIGNQLPGQLVLAYEGLRSTGEVPPAPNDATFFQTRGRTITRNRVLIQGSVGREIDPIQRVDLVGVYDPHGRSAFVSGAYTRSLSDESVWIAALQIFGNAGGPQGEFAGRGPLFYSLVRLHF